MTDHYKLYFSHAPFNFVDGIMVISEYAGCPNCEYNYSMGKTFKKIGKIKALTFNKLVTFTCPNCGDSIKLQIGIHKDDLTQVICIQRGDLGPLDDDWWVEDVM